MSVRNRLKNRVLASLLCVMATVAFAGCADPAAAPSGDTPSNIAPAAVFSTNCTLLDCSFDAVANTDPDGSVDVYSWDFGDGASAGDIKPNHSYGAEGDYTITLTVADDDGKEWLDGAGLPYLWFDAKSRLYVSHGSTTPQTN